MRVNIFGSKGFAKEVYAICKRLHYNVENFIDKEEGEPIYGVPVTTENYYDMAIPAIVAIGDPTTREMVVNKIIKRYKNTRFPVIIDPLSHILNEQSIKIGRGSILCAGSILTCDTILGEFVHLNLNATIGHDGFIGNYNTFAPLVGISGHVTTGNRVYFGTCSGCKEYVTICDDVKIGLGGAVVKNITETGTYTGVPVKKKENT